MTILTTGYEALKYQNYYGNLYLIKLSGAIYVNPLETIIGLISIFPFLLAYIPVVSKLLQELEKKPGVPPSPKFYFLFFLALFAAGLGGVLWIWSQKVYPSLYATPLNVSFNPSLGGSREPHSLAAFLWPIVTFLPSIVLFLWTSEKHKLLPGKKAILVSLTMMGSLMIASWLFYDTPIIGQLLGFQGVRSYILDQSFSYQMTEILLVIIWSAMLSTVPFLVIYSLNLRGSISGPGASLITSAYAIFATIGLTTFSIALFITYFTSPESESLRGAIAGIVLRVSLFFGLLISSNGSVAKKIADDIIESIKGP